MIEFIVVLIFIAILGFLFWPTESGSSYTYIEEEDENGNIVEKVIEHKAEDK